MNKRAKLLKERLVLIKYLFSKADSEDWYAVSDVANDFREIDAEIKGIDSKEEDGLIHQ